MKDKKKVVKGERQLLEVDYNRSKAIIQAIGDGIMIQDIDYKILYQNHIHKDQYGDKVGEYCYKIYGSGEICEGCPLELSFRDGEIHHAEKKVVRDHENFYYEFTTSPLRDPTGKIIAGIKVIRDVSERRRAEEGLKENEQFMESIFASIQDGIGVIDKDMNIVRVNQTAHKWYPEISSFIGKKCFEAFHARGEPCEICPSLRTLKTGVSAFDNAPKQDKDGNKVDPLRVKLPFQIDLHEKYRRNHCLQEVWMIKGPLEGVRVVDLSRGIAGPWATMMLGDLGAEVIRIEATAEGDVGRIIDGPKHNGESFYFLAFNRNKKSVVMDFKTPAGRQALIDLVRVSDVLVENFRPGSMDRMGLAYKDLKKINRRIIMWQNTGFGDTGPYKDRPCYEIIAQGYTGMLDLTRESPERPPVRSAPPVGDTASGYYGDMGILAALFEREKTGQGQLVRTSMIGVCMAMMCYHLSHYFLSHEIPKAVGSGHLGVVPIGAFKCQDDYVVIATGWPRIARVVGMEWVIDDPRFATLAGRKAKKFDRKTFVSISRGSKKILIFERFVVVPAAIGFYNLQYEAPSDLAKTDLLQLQK